MDLNKLKQSIKKHEGLKLKPYRCPNNKLSIGYGRNLEDNGITLQEAEKLLETDLLNIKLELVDKIKFFYKLDDVRQNVLLEMAYNMGVPKLLGFKNTITLIGLAVDYIHDFERSNYYYELASRAMLNSKWHEAFKKYDSEDGKQNNNGLLRSEYLSKIMKEGTY